MVVQRIVHGFDKVVGFRLFDFCDDKSVKMDVDIETGKELAIVYQGQIKIKQEVIPTKIVGDSYVTLDEANVISPKNWADAIPRISTKYLLGPARYTEDNDSPSELEETANKLIEAGKDIKDLRLTCALNDCDRRDMRVEVCHDNIVPLMLYLSRVTGTDFGKLLQVMYDEYRVTKYSTAEEKGIITYDNGLLSNPMFRGWSGDFTSVDGWLFCREYANPEVEEEE